MAQLRQEYETFIAKGAEVVVIGPDSVKAFVRYWEEHDLPFIGLPDPEHRVLSAFGQEIKVFRWGRMPAQVIIDRDGVVRFAHYGESMSDIPTNEELLDLLQSLE